ncbi:MAG: ABC transporter substrate-binding protein [Lachnospiraceae bacterium]|nr:ABC transporter substrate-binding protein [Candidatus Equihabitans merdae]
MMKSVKSLLILGLTLLGAGTLLTGCGVDPSAEDVLFVYNAGEYLDPDVIDLFEEETGIKVVYDEFETNEIMFPKVDADPTQYDVICPSDYMIERMLQNDMLEPLNYDLLPHAINIDETYYEKSNAFDPGNKYAIPYFWGTVGILYNTEAVEEEVTGWDVLWNEKYKDEILMQDSIRDLYIVPLKKLGYSLNSMNENELKEATDLLIQQKPLVQAYVVDEVRDKMIGDEALIGVIYSGEAEICIEANEKLDYVIPEEGTNIWIDAWVISQGSRHKEAAHQWIDFLCRADIAAMNFRYVYYSTPNRACMEEELDEEELENEILFPDIDQYENLETFHYLGKEGDRMYFDYWKELKSVY